MINRLLGSNNVAFTNGKDYVIGPNLVAIHERMVHTSNQKKTEIKQHLFVALRALKTYI